MKLIMGGSFDPVHIGHLRVATDLAELLGEKVYLMPCKQAVHKASQSCSPAQRIAMLELAVKGNPFLDIDAREVERQSESYTITSLTELREEGGAQPIVFVMGSDSAATLPTWKLSEHFHKLAHFLVLTRPGQEHSGQLTNYKPHLEALGLRHAESLEWLKNEANGFFYELPLSELAISSSAIRKRIQEKRSIRYIVTDAVERYICDNGLYALNDEV